MSVDARGERHLNRVARIRSAIGHFLRDESAATAIEYGLIAAGIAVAIVAAVKGVGSALSTKFTTVSTSLK